jgi:spore coat protein CotF
MVPSSKIEAIRQGKLFHVKTFMAKEKKREKKRSTAIRPSKSSQATNQVHEELEASSMKIKAIRQESYLAGARQ